jgi:hypothetical protein
VVCCLSLFYSLIVAENLLYEQMWKRDNIPRQRIRGNIWHGIGFSFFSFSFIGFHEMGTKKPEWILGVWTSRCIVCT